MKKLFFDITIAFNLIMLTIYTQKQNIPQILFFGFILIFITLLLIINHITNSQQ